MEIKTKLKVAFGVLLGIIIVVCLFWVSIVYFLRNYFTKFVLLKDEINLTTEIIQLLNRQRQIVDYYMLLHDVKEKENFDLTVPRTVELVNQWQQKESGIDILSQYNLFVEIVTKIFNEKDYDTKVKIIDEEFLPLYKNILKIVEDKSNIYTKKAHIIEKQIFQISIVSLILCIIIVVGSIFSSVIFVIKIYKALIKPLKILSEGTKLLAKGEYREINFNSKDEFCEVIKGFNWMVKNLKNFQTQILQMDRLSNIGQLAGGIAHELNNPLVGVLGQAQLLLEKLPLNSPLREHVEKIERAAKRCRESISRLLQFSRQKEYEYTLEDIHEVIKNTLFIADSELKAHNIETIINFGHDIPKIKISLPHIQQAFLNIINNAIQAMEEINPEKPKLLQIKTYITKLENGSSEYVVIEFQDTGCGIQQQFLEAIFEPYFTTKDKTKFAGVGLSITKDIILHHKGKITVYSEGVNKGAKFIIYLPVDFEEKKV